MIVDDVLEVRKAEGEGEVACRGGGEAALEEPCAVGGSAVLQRLRGADRDALDGVGSPAVMDREAADGDGLEDALDADALDAALDGDALAADALAADAAAPDGDAFGPGSSPAPAADRDADGAAVDGDALDAPSSRAGSSDPAADAAGLPEPVGLVAALSGGGFFLAITGDYQRKRVPMRVSRYSCRPC